MDELPELPFEKVLSYLSLEDRLKSKAVSRRWYWMISNLVRVKTLCYSDLPVGFIEGKRRLVSGAFAQNFIYSTQFESFFNTFRPTILSNLKHLRLCGLKAENLPTFASTLQSFGQLEELDIIRFNFHPSYSFLDEEFKLSLPMLTSIWFEGTLGLKKLTLDAPRLLKIKLADGFIPRLQLVHGESVEWLMICRPTILEVKDMKNLKYLYLGRYLDQIDSTLQSTLEQLKEIHLENIGDRLRKRLFEQKQRHGRTDLKIYLGGLLLNGPDDPAICPLRGSNEVFRGLADLSRVADQIPFWQSIHYLAFKCSRVTPELQVSILSRFTNLTGIIVGEPIEDTERFLGLLKNFDNIVRLHFDGDQPQDLFDRLPEHCAVQFLSIDCAPSDSRFLFQLKHLKYLQLEYSVDAEAIRKIIEANEFLSRFFFYYLKKWTAIQIEYPKRFKVLEDGAAWREVADLEAAIELITADS